MLREECSFGVKEMVALKKVGRAVNTRVSGWTSKKSNVMINVSR